MAPNNPVCLSRVFRAAIVATLFAAVGAACTQSTTASAPPVTSATTTMRVVHDVAYGPDAAQQLDLYLPVGTGPFPAMLYLHSGGWVAGSHQFVPDFVLDQVDRGVAVIAVDYRLASRDAGGTARNAFPAPVQDVDRAVRWVRANAESWGLAPDRIVLAGASAGGHLALLAAAAPGTYAAPDLPADLRDVPATVQGVMAFVAPTDLVAFGAEDNELASTSLATFLACPTPEPTSCDRAREIEASPATHLTAAAPPAYFVYGSHDALASPLTQGLPVAMAWAAARGELLGGTGAAVQFHLVDAGHNLDRSTVDLPALEQWLDTVTEVVP